MEKSTLILTRKIQILVDLPTQEERKEALDKLYRWQNRCFKAANLIVSHLYVQEMMKDFLYLSEGVKYKLMDEKKDAKGMLENSRMSTTYRVLSDRFKGEIPMNILACLNNRLHSSYNKDSQRYWKGEASLKNFKRDMAFPFGAESISKLSYHPEKKSFCFRLFQLPFKTYLGKDFTGNKKLLEQVVNGEIKLCTSQIKIEKGKIFWLAVVEIEKENHQLKPETIAEASLSLEYPLVVKVGKSRLSIGTKEEFLYRRLAIQASRKRTQVGVAYAKSGKGRTRKLKALEKMSQVCMLSK